MLQTCFLFPYVATAAKFKCPNTLRERPFNACSFGILYLKSGSLLPQASRLQRPGGVFWANHQEPRLSRRMRTQRPNWTGGAVFGGEFDLDDLAAMTISAPEPLRTLLPLGTGSP